MSTNVHLKALDAIVSTSSIGIGLVVIGLAYTMLGHYSPANTVECDAGPHTLGFMLFSEVVAFASYLSSIMLGKSMILIIKLKKDKEVTRARFNYRLVRYGMYLTAVLAMIGSLLLILSVAYLIQLKLGSFSCQSSTFSLRVVSVLIIITIPSVFFCFPLLVYMFSQ